MEEILHVTVFYQSPNSGEPAQQISYLATDCDTYNKMLIINRLGGIVTNFNFDWVYCYEVRNATESEVHAVSEAEVQAGTQIVRSGESVARIRSLPLRSVPGTPDFFEVESGETLRVEVGGGATFDSEAREQVDLDDSSGNNQNKEAA